MQISKVAEEQHPTRLSLFWLDADEMLLSFLKVQCLHPVETKGRLWLCSRSILFQPYSKNHPMMRMNLTGKIWLKYLRGISSAQVHKLTRMSQNSEVVDSVKQNICDMPIEQFKRALKEISKGEMSGDSPTQSDQSVSSLLRDCIALKASRMYTAKQSPIEAYDASPQNPLCLFQLISDQPKQIIIYLKLFDHLIKSIKRPNYNEGTIISQILREVIEKEIRQLQQQLALKQVYPTEMVTLEGTIHCLLYINQGSLWIRRIFNNPDPHLQTVDIPFQNLTKLMNYRYMMRHTAVQLWCQNDSQCYLFNFSTQLLRNEFIDSIKSQNIDLPSQPTIQQVTHKWKNHLISNYDYLMTLNFAASRSFNDPSAYPIFPWIFHQYQMGYKLDLSKPIGIINPHRLRRLKDRRERPSHLNHLPQSHELYPTYISMPCYVYYFLIRKHPELIVRLQKTIIAPPDRVFVSIEKCYYATLNNPSDFKQLTPEFYNPDLGVACLTNSHSLSLGKDKMGKSIDDVELPSWADSPYDFISKLRQALEGPYVSSHLHEWIDITFGLKTLATVRITCDNEYNPFCYESLERQSSKAYSTNVKFQIQHFGQHPPTLFLKAHPKRSSPEQVTLLIELTSSKHQSQPNDQFKDSKKFKPQNQQCDSDSLGSDIQRQLGRLPDDFFADDDFELQ